MLLRQCRNHLMPLLQRAGVRDLIVCDSRGILSPSRPDLAGTPVLLVNPRTAVPTGPVFAGWDGVDRGGLDPAAPLAALRNDLAAPAIALASVIATVIDALGRQPGATLVRMSGSGATVFALFESAAARDSAAHALSVQCPAWWCAATRLR